MLKTFIGKLINITRLIFGFKKVDSRYVKLTKYNLILGKNVHIEENAIIRIKGTGKINVGEFTEILDGVILMSYFNGNITIGNHCSINPYTIIYGVADTTIGNNVMIAGHCMIIPNNHGYSRKDIPMQHQENIYKGIKIEDDVWIGHGCSILDGSIIRKGAIVAAGSVVNTDIPEFSIYGGIPAKLIRYR